MLIQCRHITIIKFNNYLQTCIRQKEKQNKPISNIKSVSIFLGVQCKFRSQEAVILCHGCFGAVYNIAYKLFAIGYIHVGAIVILCLFPVDQEQVVPSYSTSNINV